eukprot:GHRR01025617.1.p1 GENE.GHRR01025617.1~~GHRR01025617.1.p1  ORF type:complete len:271 (+),score=48.57 GHRR01025617.1:596-1408(+)
MRCSAALAGRSPCFESTNMELTVAEPPRLAAKSLLAKRPCKKKHHTSTQVAYIRFNSANGATGSKGLQPARLTVAAGTSLILSKGQRMLARPIAPKPFPAQSTSPAHAAASKQACTPAGLSQCVVPHVPAIMEDVPLCCCTCNCNSGRTSKEAAATAAPARPAAKAWQQQASPSKQLAYLLTYLDQPSSTLWDTTCFWDVLLHMTAVKHMIPRLGHWPACGLWSSMTPPCCCNATICKLHCFCQFSVAHCAQLDLQPANLCLTSSRHVVQ